MESFSSALNALVSFSPYLKGLGLYAITVFGAASGYLLAPSREFKGCQKALRNLMPERSVAFYARMEFLIVAFMGSGLAFLVYQPAVIIQALAAGIGWFGAFQLVTNRTVGHDDQQ